jgi:hypothetical protein
MDVRQQAEDGKEVGDEVWREDPPEEEAVVMPTVSPNRIKYRCPVCKGTVSTVVYPDAIECEDDDGWIVRYHKDCYTKALEGDE